MNERSRSTNFLLNMKVGIIIQILSPIFSFISRTIFIAILGEQYLGINGLYNNILSVLSLADLGMYSVMIYSLYKPISDGDEQAIVALMNYFKKIYRGIAVAVFAIGMCIVPFIQYIFVGSALELSELKFYFVLYLLDTVCSYLIVYKTTLLKADQKIYINKITDFTATTLIHVLQILVLFLTKNYTFYLVVSIAVTLIKNFTTSKIADKMYPYLNSVKAGQISPDTRKKIIGNIKSTFIYRANATIMNSTDNILISMILGVVIVGRYYNYLTITTIINSCVMLVSESMLASIGNYNVNKNAQEKYGLFRIMMFMYYVIATFCSCCFVGMFNDFIDFWVGHLDPNYVLDNFTVYAITFNFYISCISSPLWIFRETSGLFNEVRYCMVFAAVLNIALSIVMGKLIGLPGIILATAISKILTDFWYEPRVLCKKIFGISTKPYWIYTVQLSLVSIVSIVACAVLGLMLPRSIIWAFIKIGIAGIVTLIMFVVFFGRTAEFWNLKDRVMERFFKK